MGANDSLFVYGISSNVDTIDIKHPFFTEIDKFLLKPDSSFWINFCIKGFFYEKDSVFLEQCYSGGPNPPNFNKYRGKLVKRYTGISDGFSINDPYALLYNPVLNNEITLLGSETEALASLYNTNGQITGNWQLPALRGVQTLTLPLGITQGLYLLHIREKNGEVYIRKVVLN